MNPHKMTWSFAFNFPYAQIIGVVTLLGVLFSKEPKRLPMKGPVVLLLMLLGWMVHHDRACSACFPILRGRSCGGWSRSSSSSSSR